MNEKEIRPRRNVGGGRLPVVLEEDSSDEKQNEKNTLGGRGRPPNNEETHNNQPKYSADDGGRLCDEMPPWKNVWKGAFTSFEAGIEARGDKKLKKIKLIVALGGRRTTILHNNQPKTRRHVIGEIRLGS